MSTEEEKQKRKEEVKQRRKKEHAESMLRSNRECVTKTGAKSPIIGSNGFEVSENDNVKFISVTAKLFDAPDIDMHSEEEVSERLSWYFQLMAENGMKPTVAGMGLALNGMDKRRLWEIKSGAECNDYTVKNLPPGVTEIIKKAYKILDNLHEQYMNSGKINPVTGIFLAKNHFDYSDKTEHIITPNSNTEDIVDVEEIKKRYLEEDSE